ncbi:hypothetical protein Trydic_g3784 [Trypoxylus dichotomus]
MFSKLIFIAFVLTAAHAASSWGGRGWEGGRGGSLVGIGGGYGGGLGGGEGGWGGGEGGWGGKRVDYYSPPKYEFDYGVSDGHTGDRKQQAEIRRGDVVQGEYSLKEPDGTLRIVRYEADDKNGFNAKVIRKGPAYHPEVYARGDWDEGRRGGWGDDGGRLGKRW